MTPKPDQEREPDWAHRARYIDHKANWIGVEDHIVPVKLWELGELLFPLPRARKAWPYPHHKQEYRYKPTDEKFNAYIEAGCGYGIACADDLIVIDIDVPGVVDEIMDRLPESLWQVTGSREGVHVFLKCPDLNTRQILYWQWFHDYEYFSTLRTHIGEVKADPHGYVVGPGSKHPSGNYYGPLQGDEIGSISREELLDALDEFIHETKDRPVQLFEREPDTYVDSKYEFYNLDADDVVPWLEPEKRVPHPGHGSDTRMNFMKNEDRETFMCWRHNYASGPGCGLNSRQLLAQISTGKACDTIRRQWRKDGSLHYHAWRKAVDDGLVKYDEIPYKIIRGYAISEDMILKSDDLPYEMFWDAINLIKIEIEKERINFPEQ